MVSNLEMMIRTDSIKVRSRRMTNEMKSFIYKNGRPDHMEGKNFTMLVSKFKLDRAYTKARKKIKKLKKK